MMNCVETHDRIDTRSRSMSSMQPAGLNLGITTQGEPRIVGVKCAVHRPKPNGAGIALMKTSAGVIAAARTASSWK